MDSLIKRYIEQFGEEPKIIGLFWNDQEQVTNNIIDSMDNNKPYNERDLLSENDLELFDKGELFF